MIEKPSIRFCATCQKEINWLKMKYNIKKNYFHNKDKNGLIIFYCSWKCKKKNIKKIKKELKHEILIYLRKC